MATARVTRLWGRYEAKLAARPLQTKMATSCTLMVVGDVLAQRLDPGASSDWDAKRTASMGACGLCMHAPWFHFVRVSAIHFVARLRHSALPAPRVAAAVCHTIANSGRASIYSGTNGLTLDSWASQPVWSR